LGGLGEKVSNGGTQYYFQDRVYSSESVAVSIATAFNPYYLVKVKNERSVLHSNSRAAGKNNRTTEQQNNRTTEQQNNRTTEQQNNRTTEQQNNRLN